MVYCGAPSKGCATCRRKRTKCDQKHPSCGQCLRAGRECPGYRDTQALMFRDETKKVKRKAKATEARDESISAVVAVRKKWPDQCAEPFNASKAMVVAHNLPVSLEDEAMSYFYYHFVPQGTTFGRSYLQQVRYLELPGIALLGLIASIGLGCMSNRRKDSQMMLLARQKYTEVLPVLNANLQDPVLSKADSTLMAVMLSGLFETVTCSSSQSLQSWAKHIHGALAITQLRGPKYLKNDYNRSMFHNVRAQIVIDALQRRQPVPPVVIALSKIAFSYGPLVQQTEQALLEIIDRLCILRCRTKDVTEDDPTILEEAHAIEKELVEWAESVPWEYAFLVKNKKIPDGFLSQYHVYKDAWTVGVWNVYRCCHILTHEVIMQWLSLHSTPAKVAAQRLESKVACNQLAADVCYSVPYLIGDEFSQTASNTPKAIGASSLIWPLYLVATMDLGEYHIRCWVIEQFEKIGNLFGIKQALSLANVLRTQKEITIWDKPVTEPIDEEKW